MSAPRFVSMYAGPDGISLGRYLENAQLSPGGCYFNVWNYDALGLYALDDKGRPWAYVIDNTVKWATGGNVGDPEKLRKWIPL